MYKQDLMFSLVQQQELSNSTIVDFCAEHGMKLATFLYWRKKYKLASQETKGFISITPPKVIDSTMRLQLWQPLLISTGQQSFKNLFGWIKNHYNYVMFQL